MDLKLEDPVAVLTGAGNGIGRGIHVDGGAVMR
jgi:NAD(P)-dependent dehydrogenase (short-subunit alcohol dehydrogenase family)